MNDRKQPIRFEAFDLAIDHHQGTIYSVRLDDSPDGRRHGLRVDFASILEPHDSETPEAGPSARGPSRHLRHAVVGTDDLRQLGEEMFRTVFGNAVGAAYRASVRAVRAREHGLRIRLAFDKAPRLTDLPWEALWDPTDGAYLSDRPYLVVVRWLRVAETPRRIQQAKPPLRLLALLPEPRGETPLAGTQEWSDICESLQSCMDAGQVTERRVEPATLESFRRALDDGACHVLHVVAHGLPGGPGEGGVLSLEDDEGGIDEVSGTVLMRALAAHEPPRLVVLNICHGAYSLGDDPFDGMAQTLLRRGVAAVVAMRSAISDAAAVCFATAFYAELALGHTVEAAMVAARRKLGLSPQRRELATPVLYMQGENVRLLDTGDEGLRKVSTLTLPVLRRFRRGLGRWPRVWAVLLLAIAGVSILRWGPDWGLGVGLGPPPVCPTPPGLHDLEFVVVPPGGTTVEKEPVTVSKLFCISTKEITRRDWREVTGDLPSQGEWHDDWPITDITFEEAQGFARQLEQRDPGVTYRLPTWSEWRLAAAAGANTVYFFGDDAGQLHEYGNTDNFQASDGYDGPAPVGSFKPNGLGLYDVHGNVAEWVDEDDPKGGSQRLRLGGSYDRVPESSQLGQTSWVKDEPDALTGFRIVREIPDPPEEED